MDSNVTLLNFDGAYNRQSFYHKYSYNWINFDYMRNISLFCEKNNFIDMTESIIEQSQKGIYYLGSGNYHYFSYILQSQISQPYTLILFDHHTDTIPAPGENLISCGSWVLEALQNLSMLEKAYMIGVSEEATKHVPESLHDQVILYTENSLQRNLSTITKSIINNIPTESVYISMDKDVLDRNDAITGWDHGTLRLKHMMKMVKEISRAKKLIGVDVCGEYPVHPMNEYQKETWEAVTKNNQANGFILECIKKWTGKKHTPSVLHA